MLHLGCDGCRQHVPDNAIPWHLETSGYRWRFCSLACLTTWMRAQECDDDGGDDGPTPLTHKAA